MLLVSLSCTYIVLLWSVSELIGEDVQDFPVSPSLLYIRVVREMIRLDPPQSIFQEVWSWPRIAWCSDNLRRWGKVIRLLDGRVDDGHSHAGCRNLASAQKMRKYTRRGSQCSGADDEVIAVGRSARVTSGNARLKFIAGSHQPSALG